jgi:molybdopterin converting factor small subunit
MLLGYGAALDMEQGSQPVQIILFGRLRDIVGHRELSLAVEEGGQISDALRKFFNYHPQVRPEALERIWQSEDERDSLWMEVVPAYRPRPGWRVLLNGRNVAYEGGFGMKVNDGDTISVFPPGR